MSDFDGSPGQSSSPRGNKSDKADKAPSSSTGGNEPTIPLPKIQVDKPNSQLGRQIAVGAAVAAVALLAVVSAVLGTGGSDSAAEAAEKELSTSCEANVIPLTEAIEDWDGIGSWAAAGSGTPDLGAMALVAIEDLATIEPTSDLGVAALALQRSLESDVDAAEQGDAVLEALDATAASLAAAPAPGECQTSRLQAALALG